MLTSRRLAVVLAVTAFALASFVVDLEAPLRPEADQLRFSLTLNVALPCVMGAIGLCLGSLGEPGANLQKLLTVIALSPLAVLIAALVSVQLDRPDLWLVVRRYGGLSLVAPVIVLSWSRVRVPVPLASPAAPSAMRAAWTVPALFASVAQVNIAHGVDWVHRNHEPAFSKALGTLGAAGLVVFAFADLRLLRRIQPSLLTSGASRSGERDRERLEGFAAVAYIKRSLAWNIVCALMAAGCVVWALFNAGGTYGW